ncbi:hypothetical protein RND81_01G192500 [Saponaria officinalis]|uniref:Protein ABIL1 n=1 Tax=Saponaria officinalis TaxID=3572 RepID=A0AAW1NJL5_SAPOF
MEIDEVFMERSQNFVKALQELKNLRPQLYSAAGYCEKSYLHTVHKQMLLDNFKEYAVRVVVNTVDHLGTVAYKLTDLVEQQTSEISSLEVKVTCLNQKLLTCQMYADKEGLRQQQLLAIIPRHHKRYILSNSPGSATQSWHPASETKAPNTALQKTVFSSDFQKVNPKSVTVFHVLDTEDSVSGKSYGATQKDTVPDCMPMTPFRSSDKPRQSQLLTRLFATEVCFPLSLSSREHQS